MIYDRVLQIAGLGSGSSPLDRKLSVKSAHYCAELSIYESTAIQWAAAGKRLDAMLQTPRLGVIDANDYAIYGGHVYAIRSLRNDRDEDGRETYVLSLSREEARYDILNTPVGASGGGV